MNDKIQKLLSFNNRLFHVVYIYIKNYIHSKIVFFQLWANGVTIGKNFKAAGIPNVHLSRNSKVIIGDDCSLRSWTSNSDTGENQPTTIRTRKKGLIIIGNKTGITSTLIFSETKISIGENVKIGGGSKIFDTNFHSTDPTLRNSKDDMNYAKTAPIIIEDNVFIGTNCIITKGVTIGENSIIAAGSVLTKSVPRNQIWGGNPAIFIKNI